VDHSSGSTQTPASQDSTSLFINLKTNEFQYFKRTYYKQPNTFIKKKGSVEYQGRSSGSSNSANMKHGSISDAYSNYGLQFSAVQSSNGSNGSLGSDN
jgi:hypothetical protein